jgi:Tol biopolymer transport system component/DNA-binding winged helix-turn-helix (wHTH) protein
VASGNGTRLIQFGVFEADLRAGELRRNGAKIRLQEQPFQILVMLLERPGSVVTREELRTHLWPADTFVDFDHSLNAAVRRLRDALGDTAENPRFVETVARRGYRFLAPVNGAAQASVADTVPLAQPVRKGWIAGGAAVLLLLGLGVGLYVGKRESAPWVPPAPITERRLTANPSEDPVSNAAISVDGKYLAFSDDTGFYLRQIDTGETHPLTLPKGFKARPVSWFPDGTHILVTSVAASAEQPGLWQVSTVGGSPRKLNDEGREAAVSPDGLQIVFLKEASKSQELWLMRADGQQARKVAGELGDLFRSPVWSANGKQIAFLRGVYHPGQYGVVPQIEILDIASNERKVVMSQARFGPALAWINDRLVYVLDEPPPSQNDSSVWSVKIDLHTGKPMGTATRLSTGPGQVQYLSSAADGKRLAYVKQSWQPDVYVARLEAHGSKLETPRLLTLDERLDLPWAWTPDSKQVLFGSDRDGSFHIFRQAPEQATPELLVGGKEQSMLPRLTPNGKEIVYFQYWPGFEQAQVVRMFRLSLSGGPPELVLEGRGLTNLQCARLPSTLCLYSQVDDKRLVFFSFDPSRGKRQEVAHVDDDLPYAYNWSLSPDGSTLAIAKARKLDLPVKPDIRLLSLTNHRERTIRLKEWPRVSTIDWAADGKSLWVSTSTNAGTNALLNVDLQGRARPVWEQTKMEVGWAIPSPDGRYLALWQASGSSNVWMVENF